MKSEITTTAKGSHETVFSRVSHLAKVPKLKSGHDEERAAELDSYVYDAENGLRSILKAGFFLECLAEDLPRGALGPWVEAHCKNRTWRTVRRWKQVAASLGEAVGINYKKRIALKLHEVLSLPPAKVPQTAKPILEKIENEIAGKSYRQLFLELKQSKDGEKPDRGRRKGEGGASREQRHAHKMKLHELDLIGRKAFLRNLGDAADQAANDKGIGDPDCGEEFAEAFPKIENLFRYMQRIVAARNGRHHS